MSEQQERAAFEAAIRAQYPTSDAHGARLTLRRDMPGSTRFGQYVAEHIEFAWRIWQAARSQQQGWQPISSAPKDGTELLLCDADGVRVVGRWSKHNHVPLYEWIRQVELYGEEVDGFDAVLWQPLPAPPSVSNADQHKESTSE